MVKRAIVFVFLCAIYISLFSFSVPKVHADFDCLTLNISSNPTDKAYCQNQLVQVEAELNDLLNKQKDQQKQTGSCSHRQ